jgi:hypothetical protein
MSEEKTYNHVFEFDKVFTEDFFKENEEWKQRFISSYRTSEKLSNLSDRTLDKLRGLKDTQDSKKKISKKFQADLIKKQTLYIDDIRFFQDLKKLAIVSIVETLRELSNISEKYYLSSEIKTPYIAEVENFCLLLERDITNPVDEASVEDKSEANPETVLDK